MDTLKITTWNSNTLQQGVFKTKTFLYNNNIDILLISETHFTSISYMKIPYYTIYDTKHLSGKAHGGVAVIIRNDIKYHLHSQISQEHVQATTITIQTNSNYFQISAVYAPSRHKMTLKNWNSIFNF